MRPVLNVATPTDVELVVTREFNAPRERVWDAMSKPELLRRWLVGPHGWEMTECEEDPRVGGSFRWTWSGPDRASLTITGEYQDLILQETCVRTEVFHMGGQILGQHLARLVLTDQGDRTLLTLTLLYDSKAARDGAVASGMEQGMAANYDRLDDVLQVASV